VASALTDSPALHARGLVKRFGDRTALDGVEFEVAPATRHALLGPNGSGKSTLFRIAATLLVPDAGSLTLAGIDALADPSAARRALGVVFQRASLDGKLGALENLCYAGRMHGMSRGAARQRGLELLDRFGIAERANDRVETLSGGTQRRVEIAKALLHRPRILLLDEPSTGLDPTARETLASALADLAATGVTVCYTTHLFDEAENAERVTILDRGRVVAHGEPRELAASLGGAMLRARGRDLERARQAVEEAASAAPRRLGDAWIAPCSDPGAAAARVAGALGGALDHLEITRPSLADVFARATGHAFESAESEADATPSRRTKR
jgi:ABC-2 type transport system ATP-binding protein